MTEIRETESVCVDRFMGVCVCVLQNLCVAEKHNLTCGKVLTIVSVAEAVTLGVSGHTHTHTQPHNRKPICEQEIAALGEMRSRANTRFFFSVLVRDVDY